MSVFWVTAISQWPLAFTSAFVKIPVRETTIPSRSSLETIRENPVADIHRAGDASGRAVTGAHAGGGKGLQVERRAIDVVIRGCLPAIGDACHGTHVGVSNAIVRMHQRRCLRQLRAIAHA